MRGEKFLFFILKDGATQKAVWIYHIWRLDDIKFQKNKLVVLRDLAFLMLNTPGPQVVRVPLMRIPLMRIIKISAFV